MNVWDDILARIETKVNRHSFYTWFRPTSFVAEDRLSVTIRVPNPLFKDWLTKHYAGVIAEAMNRSAPGRGDATGHAELEAVRIEFAGDKSPMVISGCIGPSGDGYDPATWMTEGDAEQYHRMQAETFRDTEADMITAITMTHAPEAIGVTKARSSRA